MGITTVSQWYTIQKISEQSITAIDIIMAVLSAIILTTLLLAYTEGSPVDCGERYQNLLGDLVKLKKTCDTAKFRDCCQVYRSNIIVP